MSERSIYLADEASQHSTGCGSPGESFPALHDSTAALTILWLPWLPGPPHTILYQGLTSSFPIPGTILITTISSSIPPGGLVHPGPLLHDLEGQVQEGLLLWAPHLHQVGLDVETSVWMPGLDEQ